MSHRILSSSVLVPYTLGIVCTGETVIIGLLTCARLVICSRCVIKHNCVRIGEPIELWIRCLIRFRHHEELIWNPGVDEFKIWHIRERIGDRNESFEELERIPVPYPRNSSPWELNRQSDTIEIDFNHKSPSQSYYEMGLDHKCDTISILKRDGFESPKWYHGDGFQSQNVIPFPSLNEMGLNHQSNTMVMDFNQKMWYHLDP